MFRAVFKAADKEQHISAGREEKQKSGDKVDAQKKMKKHVIPYCTGIRTTEKILLFLIFRNSREMTSNKGKEEVFMHKEISQGIKIDSFLPWAIGS